MVFVKTSSINSSSDAVIIREKLQILYHKNLLQRHARQPAKFHYNRTNGLGTRAAQTFILIFRRCRRQNNVLFLYNSGIYFFHPNLFVYIYIFIQYTNIEIIFENDILRINEGSTG